ncbi:hypothetical protein AURDEDRAFT_129574 [Auricularia subglabra TFB-10046 SS5]|nr:hypothetical protein AURDEDRAFT_129574 [Auricularia subglabra TFB-10046 SS5]
MKIPNELTYAIATLLPLSMIFRLALVCSRWRDLLLSCPELWTHIHVAFGRSSTDKERTSRPVLWEPLMAAFLVRSQDLPLVVDIYVGDAIGFQLGDPDCEELIAVSDLLSANMHRVKSLWLSFLFAARHRAAPLPFLRAPAPILKALHLHVRSAGDSLAIHELFSSHAPLLKHVELDGKIVIREKPFTNLPSITQLCYKRQEWDRLPSDVMGELLKQLPSLQRLTLDSNPFKLAPPCLKPLDLQIRVQKRWDPSPCFPKARSICYALGGVRANNNQEVSAANLGVALERYSREPVTSLEMHLCPLIVQPPVGPKDSTVIGMTVKVDGVYIAVDADWIRHSRLIARTLYLHDLERLVLHEGNWDDFMDLKLPLLRELTVHLHRTPQWWPLKRPSAQRQAWALSVLRFARTLSIKEQDTNTAGALPTIEAVDVATLISHNFDPLALQKIILRGWGLSEPGADELMSLAPQAEIVYKHPVVDDDWVPPTGWPTRFVESGCKRPGASVFRMNAIISASSTGISTEASADQSESTNARERRWRRTAAAAKKRGRKAAGGGGDASEEERAPTPPSPPKKMPKGRKKKDAGAPAPPAPPKRTLRSSKKKDVAPDPPPPVPPKKAAKKQAGPPLKKPPAKKPPVVKKKGRPAAAKGTSDAEEDEGGDVGDDEDDAEDEDVEDELPPPPPPGKKKGKGGVAAAKGGKKAEKAAPAESSDEDGDDDGETTDGAPRKKRSTRFPKAPKSGKGGSKDAMDVDVSVKKALVPLCQLVARTALGDPAWHGEAGA